MWQPNRAQWRIIWAMSVVAILAWPPGEGRSLAVKIVSWAVDPRGSLPTLPGALPMGLDDHGDAVAVNDARETEYYRLYQTSSLMRWRLKLKAATDPFDPSTTRQVLAGMVVLAALSVWRLAKPAD